jgi:UDP:flavonoid glycosyltransferase YjiC (YdhE family)
MIKRVLIAPLDWGLGHTARCIPIIQELLQQGHQVIFAGTQKQFDFVTQHQISIKH